MEGDFRVGWQTSIEIADHQVGICDILDNPNEIDSRFF